ERMLAQCDSWAIQLTRERACTQVADGADFEWNAASGEQVHQCGIVNRGNAMADAFDTQSLDGFADFLRAANFAGVDESMQPGIGCGVVNWQKVFRGDAHFIAADAESDNFRRGAMFCCLDNTHGGVRAELADGVKNPPQRQTARFELVGGANNRSKVC